MKLILAAAIVLVTSAPFSANDAARISVPEVQLSDQANLSWSIDSGSGGVLEI